MGQITLPILNRTGTYSHWSSSGDNIYNNSKLIKQSIFIKKLLFLFLSQRSPIFNRVSTTKLEKSFLSTYPDQLHDDYLNFSTNSNEAIGYIIGDNIQTTPSGNDIPLSDDKNLCTIKRKLNLLTTSDVPVYLGKVLFLKQGDLIVTIAHFFKPLKGELKKKKRQKFLKISMSKSLKSLKFGHYLNNSNITSINLGNF